MSKTHRKWSLLTPAVAGCMAVAVLGNAEVGLAAETEVLRNGGFTADTSGWRAEGGTLQRIAANPLAELVNTSGATRLLTLNDRANTVTPVVPGRTYSASVRVRPVGRTADVEFRGQEWGNPTGKWEMAGSAGQRKTLPRDTWTRLTYTYTAKRAGFTLDVNLLVHGAIANQVVQVDDVEVRDNLGKHYAVNGAFDAQTTGWYLSTPGTLRSGSDAQDPVSGPFGRLSNTAASPQPVRAAADPGPAAAGDRFDATAKLRGSAGQQAVVRIVESKNGAAVAEQTKSVTFANGAWTSVSAGYTAKQNGSTVSLEVAAPSLAAGAAVDLDDASLKRTENQAPTAAFSAGANNLRIDVDASSSADPDGSLASYEWDFGDGSSGSGATTSHTYAAAGTYAVTLTVTDDGGARHSVTKSVTATAPNVAPAAAFTSRVTDLRVSFDAAGSKDPDGRIETYAWDFGDGATGSGVTAEHSYAAAGTYTVRLTVTDDRGGKDTVSAPVSATRPNDAPTAAFGHTTDGLKVSVNGSASSDSDGSVVSYAWDFGDGNTATGASAARTYTTAGTYTVRLTVTDDRGATHSTTKAISVSAPPPPPPPAPSGWKLHFADEFDGAALNSSNWLAYNNTYGDGNNELACLTPNNVKVAGGSLTLTSKKEAITCPGGKARNYSSAFLGSRDAGKYHPLYGRYEIRARLPHGQGVWPAFWLRHRNGAGAAEVDILELFHSQAPGKATQTLHFPNSIGTNVSKRTTFFETPVKGTGGWHTFAVEIEPVTGADGTTDVRFRFLIDDKQTHEYVNTKPESWNQVDPKGGWDIAINTAVGGNWAGNPEGQLGYLAYPKVCSLTYKAPTNGDPATCPTTGIHLAQLPATYEVDYVRVYTR